MSKNGPLICEDGRTFLVRSAQVILEPRCQSETLALRKLMSQAQQHATY